MTAIFKILKFIGLALLWILAVILLVLLVVLICPVFYEIRGEKYDKATASAKIKLLLGILSVRLGYDGENVDFKIKILGKELNLGKKGKNDEAEADDNRPAEKKDKPEKEEKPKAEKIKEEKPEEEKPKEEKPKEEKPKEEKPRPSEKPKPPSRSVPERKTEPKLSVRPADWENTEGIQGEPEVRRIKFSEIKPPEKKPDISNIDVRRVKMPDEVEVQPDEVRRIKNPKKTKSDEDFDREGKEESREESTEERLDLNYFIKMPKEERKQLISAAMKLIKSLLRGVKPRDFCLKGTLGLSDPSLTGEIAGAAWAMNGIFDKRIELEAVFDREVIEGEFSVKGHIIPALMLFYIVRFIVTKPVRKIIKLLVKGDKNGK